MPLSQAFMFTIMATQNNSLVAHFAVVYSVFWLGELSYKTFL